MKMLELIEHHNVYVYKVSESPIPNATNLHVAFRNVVAKQHFSYALKTAWPHVIVINRFPGEARMMITVPLGS